MTPTIALKFRLDGNLRQEMASRRSTRAAESRRISIGSLTDLATNTLRDDANEDDAVQLLLSMSNIVSNEIKNDATVLDVDDDDSSKDEYDPRPTTRRNENWLLSPPRDTSQSPTHSEEDMFQWNRIRSVSIDSPLLDVTSRHPLSSNIALGAPALPVVSPFNTPVGRGRPLRRASLKSFQKAKREKLKLPKIPEIVSVSTSVKDYKRKAQEYCASTGAKLKTIGRKKFSWKNYPELEAFLIANREEYLRHSALNYTVQQKQYNNRLTEQLLELASEHGYVFDEVEFSFVTVRDRIRCYFKSYVQSAKKRGITVGYAARKAGLLTEDDLRVQEEGQIVVPANL